MAVRFALFDRESKPQTHPLRVLRALCGKKKKNLTTEGTENTESQYRRLLSVTGKPVSYLPLESLPLRPWFRRTFECESDVGRRGNLQKVTKATKGLQVLRYLRFLL
jgi:hypothetical protein